MSPGATAKTPIFLTGATGYIGGSVLDRLLKHKNAATFDITVLVRAPEKAKLLETQFGVTAVVGSLSDLHTIEVLAENAHVIVSCADCDDLPSMYAFVAGMRKRAATTGDVPILIHTSGTGVLIDASGGDYATENIYTDLDIAHLETLSPTAPHRVVDLQAVEADQSGFARTHIILPPLIFGLASGPLVDAGIQNPHSRQIPNLIDAALDRKQGGVIGVGTAIWSNVHVDDVADLYIQLYDAIVADPDKVAHGREGFYFAENGEQSWLDISKGISKALVEVQIGGKAEPTTFTSEELVKYFGAEFLGKRFGGNSRSRALRARAMGWNPKKTTEDLFSSIKLEVETLWAKKQQHTA